MTNGVQMTAKSTAKGYWNELRLRQTLKITLAFIVCVLIVNIFHLSVLAFIAPISAFVIMVIFPYQTISNSIQRVLGPLIFSIIAIVVIHFVHTPLLYFSIMFLMFMIANYMFAIERYGYAGLLGGVISAVVFVYGIQQGVAAALTIGFYFVVQCAVGVIVAIMVSKLIWPITRESQLLPQLALLFEGLKDELLQEKSLTVESFSGIKAVLKNCKAELNQQEYAFYQHVLVTAKLMYFKISSLHKSQASVVFTDLDVSDGAKKIHACLRNYLEVFSLAIKDRSYCGFDTSQFDDLKINLHKKLNALRDEGELLQYPIIPALEFVNYIESLALLKQNLIDLKELNNHVVKQEPLSKKLRKFLKPEQAAIFPLNTDGVKKAFKISLTVAIIFLLTVSTGFYGGVQALITSAVIVAQPNLGRSKHKLFLRFFGIVIGGIAGLFCLMVTVHFASFFVLIALISIATLIFSYLALGGDRVSYLGVQAAIIIPLILLSSLGPHLNMEIALHRFVGVIIGGFIGFCITVVMFPMHPKVVLYKKIRSALLDCEDVLTALLRNKSNLNLQEKISKGLNGNTQSLTDLLDYKVNTDDKYFLMIFSTIQDCFEQFIQLKDKLDAINNSELCRLLQRDLKYVTLKMPSLFENLAEYLNGKPINRLKVELLMNNFASILQTYREKRITTNYDFGEIIAYSNYISAVNHLFQCLIRLKSGLLALQNKSLKNQIVVSKRGWFNVGSA